MRYLYVKHVSTYSPGAKVSLVLQHDLQYLAPAYAHAAELQGVLAEAQAHSRGAAAQAHQRPLKVEHFHVQL